MIRSLALLTGVVALAGCPTTKSESGDTGVTPGTCTPPTGAPIIAVADVSCDTSDNVTFFASTTGWVQQGGAHNAYAIDSQNTSSWSESHPMDTTTLQRDECESYDEVEVTLATRIYGGPTGTDFYEEGVSSFFTCSEHYTKPVMSYAMEIFDSAGNQADCFAFGEDPAGLVAGDYSGAGATPEMNLADCIPATAR